MPEISWIVDDLQKPYHYEITEFIHHSHRGVKTLIRKGYDNGKYHWEFSDGGWFKDDTQAELEKWYQTTYVRNKKLERIHSYEK